MKIILMISLKFQVLSHLTDCSNQKCYLCGKTSSEFNGKKNSNTLTEEEFAVIMPENLEYGLPVLHAWIRFLENVLHIAYRLPFRKWRVHNKV